MNNQIEAVGSHPVVTDCNSALYHSGSLENHVFALPVSALGEAMISFARGQSSGRVADELWSTASIHNADPIVPSPPPFCHQFESTCLPFTGVPVGANTRLNEETNSAPSRLSLSLATSRKTYVGSRFLEAMQGILAQVAYYAVQDFDQTSHLINHNESSFSSTRLVFHNKRDAKSKKKHLLSLLQMVDDQYNQCMDEIHTVVSAFHAVTELDPSLHARFALPKVSLMYRSLRDRISSYILAIGDEVETRDESPFEMSKQWALRQLSKSDHHLWRPQRGLPERSVSVLKTWMYQNFLHPYPKDAEKQLLAMKSGLTRSQVSNWFINARVRLWKPMIEEMYAEMHRRKARRNEEEMNNTLRNQMSFDSIRFAMGGHG